MRRSRNKSNLLAVHLSRLRVGGIAARVAGARVWWVTTRRCPTRPCPSCPCPALIDRVPPCAPTPSSPPPPTALAPTRARPICPFAS